MSVPNFLHPVAEYLAPTLKNSRFSETGVLTPEEFVLAGDFLVYKCPTWSWQSGEPGKFRPQLPNDKQYLVTKNVPSLKRARALEYAVDDENDDGNGWTVTHSSRTVQQDIPDINGPEDSGSSSGVVNEQVNTANQYDEDSDGDSDDIPDIEEFGDVDLIEEQDPSALSVSTAKAADTDIDNILKTRTYDISITYDKYYKTPRVWLFGYDEQHQPLSPEQVFEDISQEHSHKTVTIELHPHLTLPHASIHPCKHAPVMKKLIDQLEEVGIIIRVDQYLLLFLKFISSVIPTVEYDYTI